MPSSAWKKDVCSRSEEHTSELQSPTNLVCRLLLEKKKKQSGYASMSTRPNPTTKLCYRHGSVPPWPAGSKPQRASLSPIAKPLMPVFFFFNDTATPEIYTFSLPAALPI